MWQQTWKPIGGIWGYNDFCSWPEHNMQWEENNRKESAKLKKLLICASIVALELAGCVYSLIRVFNG